MSVIVPAWNAAATLDRAVDSVLAQTGVRVEVIVIDDGSTDGTLAVARALAGTDPRVTALALGRNRGPAAARNIGLAEARGRFVTPLDSDDFLQPGRLSALVGMAERDGWDVVADDLWQIAADAPAQADPRRLFSDDPIGTETVTLRGFVRGNMTGLHGGRREIGFLKPLMRRAFLMDHGLRYREDMRLGEDYDFYAHALLRGARFCLTDPMGYVAVMRPGSLSGHHDADALRALVRSDDRLLSDPDLDPADAPILRAHRIETMKRWAWMELIEAVRARDTRRGMGAFAVPPSVQVSLCARLGEQAWLRGIARARALLPAASNDRRSS